MKKLAFTLQVFGLMALLPAYVILEMNHEVAATSRNHDQLSKNVAQQKMPISATFKSGTEAKTLYSSTYFGVLEIGLIKIK